MAATTSSIPYALLLSDLALPHQEVDCQPLPLEPEQHAVNTVKPQRLHLGLRSGQKKPCSSRSASWPVFSGCSSPSQPSCRGSSGHGEVHQAPLTMEILQARIPEWVAIPFSRGLLCGTREVNFRACGEGSASLLWRPAIPLLPQGG